LHEKDFPVQNKCNQEIAHGFIQHPDRIERSVLINAAPSKVWKALTHAEEFGGWFGVALKGKAFAAGRHSRATSPFPALSTCASTC
jgi:hypothetical protein